MTKAEIVNIISQKTGHEKKQVMQIFETTFKTIRSEMCQGKNIYIRGFATFKVKYKAAKPARIISKNKQIMLSDYYVPAIKPCTSFKKQMKKEYSTKDHPVKR